MLLPFIGHTLIAGLLMLNVTIVMTMTMTMTIIVTIIVTIMLNDDSRRAHAQRLLCPLASGGHTG